MPIGTKYDDERRIMNSNNQVEVKVNDQSNETEGRVFLSVVMPCYNEGAHIRENLLEASRIISKFVKKYQIIAVNDGSSDNTREEILRASIENPRIYCISYEDNKGKGYAIRKGVHYANGEYIAFLDSDLELNPDMLRYFIKALQATGADIAIGSKLHKKSKLEYPLRRKIMSVGYYLMLKLMFHLNIKDTQTGIKLFKASVIKPICEELHTTGFAFDIEILATANMMGYRIIEMPVQLVFKRERSVKSRFTFGVVLGIFKDTLSVKKILKEKKKRRK